jgi:hypothetical protein
LSPSLGSQLVRYKWGKMGFPLPHRLMSQFNAPLQEHLGQIPTGSSWVSPLEDVLNDPQDIIGRISTRVLFPVLTLPVNPRGGELFGERVFRSLGEIDVPVDVVEVFRPAKVAPEIARQAVANGAKALWLQLGIVSKEEEPRQKQGIASVPGWQTWRLLPRPCRQR